MCIFRSKRFELYPERTRLREDYYQDGETKQQHNTRILAKRRAQNAANREANRSGQIPAYELAQLKAAERPKEYRA